MKKLVIVLMSVMMLTLTSCGSSEPNPNDALVEKYKPIIDALEAGDPETAVLEVAKIAESIKEEALKDATVVELTMDNFNEYFEIVPATICWTNAFNEIDGMATAPGLKIKDAYVGKISLNNPISCDISYTYQNKECDVNLKTGEISNIRDSKWSYSSEETSVYEYNFYPYVDWKVLPENTLTNGGGWSVSAVKGNSSTSALTNDADYYEFYELSNIVLNRVIGTIYITK